MIEFVSISCITEFDPKVVRVELKLGEIYYGIDIPSPLYPEIGAQFGWPTNPCTEENEE